MIIAMLHLTAALVATASPATLPWDMEALSPPPRTWPAEGFNEEGVRALFYEGLPFKGMPTRVFAWYGVPEHAEGQKLPAMVLVHGGGGTAFAEWVRLWNKRGYAAIAMDTCGCVPRGEYGKWERLPDGGPEGWGGMDKTDDAVADQWTCHAVADAILAHSLIRSFPEVDPEKIGLTGISWGGYLTCIIAGVDSRFKCAIPVYGCGFLGEDSAWLDAFASIGPEKTAKWLAFWDPSVYLPLAPMPMLWVTGTNDFAYPMNSLQKSYRLPKAPRRLCIRLRMPHGHGGAGENPEEIRAFADHFLLGKPVLPTITGQGRDDRTAWLTYESETPITGAELLFTKDTGKWPDRNWEAVPANLDAGARKVSAVIPDGAAVYYLNITDDRQCAVSTEHEVLAP